MSQTNNSTRDTDVFSAVYYRYIVWWISSLKVSVFSCSFPPQKLHKTVCLPFKGEGRRGLRDIGFQTNQLSFFPHPTPQKQIWGWWEKEERREIQFSFFLPSRKTQPTHIHIHTHTSGLTCLPFWGKRNRKRREGEEEGVKTFAAHHLRNKVPPTFFGGGGFTGCWKEAFIRFMEGSIFFHFTAYYCMRRYLLISL